MKNIEQFIELEKQNIQVKKQSIKTWKKNSPDAPHEYEILNSAWVAGEENILNKLEQWLKKATPEKL